MDRMMVVNRIMAPATVLTASASAPASPVAWLKDQQRPKSWRSPVGWTIVAGENNHLEFLRQPSTYGDALITPGTYVTGAALATEIAAQLATADPVPTYGCTYDSGTHKFTITISGVGDPWVNLLFGTGIGNKHKSIHPDIGFASADTGQGTSHTAGSASYQSRHAVYADLGSALGVLSGIAINHNSGATGTYALQGSATTLSGAGYGVVPTIESTLAGDANIRAAYLANEASYRYWRLLINDVGNALGYAEVGIWYAGPTIEIASFGPNWKKEYVPGNEIVLASSGAHFVDEKTTRPAWSGLIWPGRSAADRDALMAALALVPAGVAFFYEFDSTAPTSTEYVMLEGPVGYTHVEGEYSTPEVPRLLGVI